MSCCRKNLDKILSRGRVNGESERLFLYLKCKRRSSWIITFNSLTILVNKKLSKVPLNVVAKDPPFAFLQELIQRRSVLSIHLNLIHNTDRFEKNLKADRIVMNSSSNLPC